MERGVKSGLDSNSHVAEQHEGTAEWGSVGQGKLHGQRKNQKE